MEQAMQKMYDYVIAHPNSSELEIARGVGLKKTPYTRGILFSLWQQGYVIRWLDDSRLRPTFVYYVQETAPMEGV